MIEVELYRKIIFKRQGSVHELKDQWISGSSSPNVEVSLSRTWTNTCVYLLLTLKNQLDSSIVELKLFACTHSD